MKEFIWVLICITLISCKSQEQHKSHISQIEKKIVTDETDKEIFDSFYRYFVEDSIFQKDRIIIPETVISPFYGDAGVTRDTVWTMDTEKWEYISIKSTTEVEIQGDTAYIVGELLTNKSINLFKSQFYIMNGKWYLDLTTSPNYGLVLSLMRSF